LKEFSFQDECDNMQFAATRISNFPSYHGVKLSIPSVVSISKSGSMLLQTFEQGDSLNKILANGDSRKYTSSVVYFFGHMLFDGWFHGDLHPGNIIVNGNRLIFIDWGSLIKLPQSEKILLLITHVCHNMESGPQSGDMFTSAREVIDPSFNRSESGLGRSSKLHDYLKHFGKEMSALGLHIEDEDGKSKSDLIHGIFALLLTFDLQIKNSGDKCDLFDDIMKNTGAIRNPDWFVALQKQYNFFIGMMKKANCLEEAKKLWKNEYCLDSLEEKRDKEADKIYSACNIL